MAVTVPQITAKHYMATDPSPAQQQRRSFVDAWAEGKAIGNKKRLNKQLKQDKEAIMAGNTDLLNNLATGYGNEGAVLAKNIQGVIAGNDKLEHERSQRNLETVGNDLARILDMPEEKKKTELIKMSRNALEAGNRDQAKELLDLSYLKGSDQDDALQSQLEIATIGNESLKSFYDLRYGDTKKIRETLTPVIRDSQKKLSARIDVIGTSWNKIDSLVDEATKPGKDGKPNRTAMSSVLVGLVKLQDPNSAVLLGEMAGAINTESPVAAIVELLRGKGTPEGVIKSVLGLVDPLSPELIDADKIRSTARALVSGQLSPMQQSYQDNIIKAGELSPQGARAVMAGNFGDRLLKMNAEFMTGDEGINSQDLSYLEMNDLRKRSGLEPLRPTQGYRDRIEADLEIQRAEKLKIRQDAEDEAFRQSQIPAPSVDPYTGLTIDLPEGEVLEVEPDTGLTAEQYVDDKSFEQNVQKTASPEAIADLRANDTPEMRQYFIEIFGMLPEGF